MTRKNARSIIDVRGSSQTLCTTLGPLQVGPEQFYWRLRVHLSNQSFLRRLRPNETLYSSGTEGRNVYFVESGCMKVLMLSQHARQCLLDICTRGDMVGISSLLGRQRPETVTAMSPCVLRVIPRAEFLDIVERNLVNESLRYFAAKLEEQHKIVSYFVTANSEGRLAATLLRLARKLGRPHGTGLLIDERITQEDLGEIVGTTRSRVGYFLKRFREAGLIEQQSRTALVVNENRLDEYVHDFL